MTAVARVMVLVTTTLAADPAVATGTTCVDLPVVEEETVTVRRAVPTTGAEALVDHQQGTTVVLPIVAETVKKAAPTTGAAAAARGKTAVAPEVEDPETDLATDLPVTVTEAVPGDAVEMRTGLPGMVRAGTRLLPRRRLAAVVTPGAEKRAARAGPRSGVNRKRRNLHTSRMKKRKQQPLLILK